MAKIDIEDRKLFEIILLDYLFKESDIEKKLKEKYPDDGTDIIKARIKASLYMEFNLETNEEERSIKDSIEYFKNNRGEAEGFFNEYKSLKRKALENETIVSKFGIKCCLILFSEIGLKKLIELNCLKYVEIRSSTKERDVIERFKFVDNGTRALLQITNENFIETEYDSSTWYLLNPEENYRHFDLKYVDKNNELWSNTRWYINNNWTGPNGQSDLNIKDLSLLIDKLKENNPTCVDNLDEIKNSLSRFYNNPNNDPNPNNDTNPNNDPKPDLKKELDILKFCRNLILEGVPGTGKTFVFKKIVDNWNGDSSSGANEESVIDKAITLHPAVTYEDFMEGLRPVSNQDEDGTVEEINAKNIDAKNTIFKKIDFFHVKRGISSESGFYYKYGFFLRICCEAVNNPYKDYLVLLDEINRCNIPKVFGDLITTMENSKRGIWVPPNSSVSEASGDESDKGCWDLTNSQVVALPGSGRLFFVPGNIYIVATMNTSDRSVAPLDAALRRRFAFHRIQPKGFDNNLELKYVKNSSDSCEKIAKDILNEFPPDFCDVVEKWCEINYLLKDKLGEDAMLGHSYLYDLAKKLKEAASINGNLVEHFWNHDVLPDLSEIFNSNNYNKKDIEGFFSLNVTLKDHFTVTELAVGSNRSSRIVYKQDEKKVSDKIANSANTSE